MDQLIPSMQELLVPFVVCFRFEVFETFHQLLGVWIVCLGRRSVSRLWETTGQAEQENHCRLFRFFSAAAWDWDEVCAVLISLIVSYFLPGGEIWVVLDDTLCHKRGLKVAFGGIFLDPVLSSKKHKVFRFAHNWVMVGLVVRLPFRPDRWFCLPVLWRLCPKKQKRRPAARPPGRPRQGSLPAADVPPSPTKPELAAAMVQQLTRLLPSRRLIVVADGAYIGKPLLGVTTADVHVLGPIRWDAALSKPVAAGADKRRKKGERLPNPKELLADDQRWPVQAVVMTLAGEERQLEVKVIGPVCWYDSCKDKPLQLVLVRDPAGQLRNEALVTTDGTRTAEAVISGYCRRWSVEVAFAEAKQLLGFHDQGVWCERSVQRAAPMAWLIGSLIVLWYTRSGQHGPQAQRHRPWYEHKVTPVFADMLAACRCQHWQQWQQTGSANGADPEEKLRWLVEYIATAA